MLSRSAPPLAELCHELVETGRVVLHGSNTARPLAVLEPRQANDAAKASGNMNAVYATTDVDVALMHAVLDRRRLSELFDSFVVGHRVLEGRLTLKVTDNVYSLLVESPSPVWSDGFVYVLDRSGFAPGSLGGSEFVSPVEVAPLLTLPVPAAIGGRMFGVGRDDGADTVVAYSPAETERLAAHVDHIEGLSRRRPGRAVTARSRPGGAQPWPPP